MSTERSDLVAGTASTVRAFLLVENPGPWGVDAVRDSRFPVAVKDGLRKLARVTGTRVLMIRRHRRQAPRADFRVFAAYADPHEPWIETSVLGRAEALLELDLAALGAGRSPGLTSYGEPVLGVCTHGRHDVCCAERGRPVAAALASAHPEHSWEVSHIGGDRFAANLLVLPFGLYYGRLDKVSALTVAGATMAGHVDLDHLRGRSGYAMPVQAAEIVLREHLAETRIGALRLTSRSVTGDVTEASFAVEASAEYAVRVRTHVGEELSRLTCGATRESGIPAHELMDIRRR